MIITLVGYMGSGKSTTGKDLAKTLCYEFIDLDQYIEEKYELSVTELFNQYGELGFRKREREALHEVLHLKTNTVLSVGGGTPVYYDNMDVINQYSTSIYINVLLPHLVKRLEYKKQNRPLIANVSTEDLPEFIAKHLFERNPYYFQSHHMIKVTTQNSFEVLNEIMEVLKK